MRRMGPSRIRIGRRLELLQQTVDVIEFLLSAARFARTPAELFENFARARQIRLVGDPHRAACHRALLVERTAERIELLLAARLLAFALLAGLLLLVHHVLRHLLGAVAKLIERALL
jgi:hypothetical protein